MSDVPTSGFTISLIQFSSSSFNPSIAMVNITSTSPGQIIEGYYGNVTVPNIKWQVPAGVPFESQAVRTALMVTTAAGCFAIYVDSSNRLCFFNFATSQTAPFSPQPGSPLIALKIDMNGMITATNN